MRKFTQFLLIQIVLSLLVGCAKDRPVMKLPDPEGDRMQKKFFTGNGAPLKAADFGDKGKYWASKVTVVNTSPDSGFAFAGFQSELKIGYFEFTREKLKFLNAVMPYKGKINALPELINEWDVTHSEKRLAEMDGKVTNQEQEDPYKNWEKKNFFTLDWAKSNISEAATFPYSLDWATTYRCWQKKAAYLVEGSREVSDDYISFTIGVDYQQNSLCNNRARDHHRGNFTFSLQYKYSFVRVKKTDYDPYVFRGENDPLQLSKYGYFRTVKEGLKQSDETYENTFLMNRWHPKKTHTYYFDQDFPEAYKPMLRDIFAKTNQLYGKYKLNNYNPQTKSCTQGLCFQILDNDGTKKFGDGRYSFVKIIETLDSGSPFGYGPSDADPRTGEIVAGNIIIWTGAVKYYLKVLRDRLGREKGKFEKSSIFQKLKVTLGEADHTKWTKTAKKLDRSGQTGRVFDYLLGKFTYGYPGWAQFTQAPYPGLSKSGEAKFNSANMVNSLFKLKNMDTLQDLATKSVGTRWAGFGPVEMDDMQYVVQAGLREIAKPGMHERDSTIYSQDAALSGASHMMAKGKSNEEILETILYRVIIHEFGHNLGLRHNFYGSVDRKNFRTKRTDGKESKYVATTSSVMDYLTLKDEMHLDHNWEQYDEAALIFSATKGKIDISEIENKSFLYCTDEHRVLNAMCNVFDQGTTPSEVTMSLIEDYEDRYWLLNYRYGRAYWNTNYYASRMFGTMFQMKKTLQMWRTAFNAPNVKEKLRRLRDSSGKKPLYKDETIGKIYREIREDLKQSVKLSMAFYNSVIQQSPADRDWRTKYEDRSGETKALGIIWDKIFAALFMMGDQTFMYNPSTPTAYASYLSMIDGLGDRNVVEKIFENNLTVRYDMEPWFIGFSRVLYALNASNFTNLQDPTLIDRMRLECYRPETFKKNFGIADLNAIKSSTSLVSDRLGLEILPMEDLGSGVTDPYFKDSTLRLGVIEVDGDYYVASEEKNRYAFTLLYNLVSQPKRFSDSIALGKADVRELYRLYNLVTKGIVPTNCK